MNPQFDSVAKNYDASFSETIIGKAQRQIVWNYLDKYLPTTSISILEINCGTGEDAIFLAKKGHTILATDASANMIEVAHGKITQQGLASKIETAVWDLNQPFPFTGRTFDLIFSNFGGLNCLSPEELKQFSLQCEALLNANGKMIFIVMGRICLMESSYFLLKGKFSSMFRRNTNQAVKVRIDEQTAVDTWYYSPAELSSIFNNQFLQLNKIPVGLFIPPSYMEPFIAKQKFLRKLFFSLDHLLGRINFLAGASDHYLLAFKKR